MKTPERGYGREDLKAEAQRLEQAIARLQAGGRPESEDEKDLDNMLARYKEIQLQLDPDSLDEAA